MEKAPIIMMAFGVVIMAIGLLYILQGVLEPSVEFGYVTTTTFCDKSFSECEDRILFSMFEFCQENIKEKFVLDCVDKVGLTKITEVGNGVYKVEIPKSYVQLEMGK